MSFRENALQGVDAKPSIQDLQDLVTLPLPRLLPQSIFMNTLHGLPSVLGCEINSFVATSESTST